MKRKTDVLRDTIREAKDFKRSHRGKYSLSDQAIFDDIRRRREEARVDRDSTLLAELDRVARNISRKSFEVDFSSLSGPGGKAVYVIPDDEPDPYYALKALDRNLRALYKISPANRNVVVDQLVGFIGDGFPYHIVRADIKSFFESIPHDGLLRKLRDDQLLSQTSMRLLSQILHSYGRKSGSLGVGLPRGLNISSYLSELYMRDFDRRIKDIDGVVFYARYVDDIAVVFAPSPQTDARDFIRELEAGVIAKGLSLNPTKTCESPLDNNGRVEERNGWFFEYLGYRFSFSPKLKVTMSGKRLARYKTRVDASFRRYESQRARNARAAYRLLVKRVRFISGNTQLSHNKSNAYVGIYFSNPHLSEESDLKELDVHLRKSIAKLTSPSLKAKLSRFSFVRGYRERTFRRFHRSDEFSEIVRAWKYE